MDYREQLSNFIANNVEGTHNNLNTLSSVTTYAREIGLYTAFYIPFECRTDEEVYNHIVNTKTVRAPWYINSNNRYSKEATTVADIMLQNQQHQLLLQNAKPTQRFLVNEDYTLVEGRPYTFENLIGKHGVIGRNHLTRTVTYSGHGVAIPARLQHPNNLYPVIGIPHNLFHKLQLNTNTPIMFLRNPVIQTGGIHFAYPIETNIPDAIKVDPCFCSSMNLDFDGDQVIIYAIKHPSSIEEVTKIIKERYHTYKWDREPSNKDFKLKEHNFKSLSLQDYVNNTKTMQTFIDLEPSKKCNQDLIDSARDLCKSRTAQEFEKHLYTSTSYKGLFQSKADIGKIGGIYKKLVYAFPNAIPDIMEFIAPLQQSILDAKHTTSSVTADDILNAFKTGDKGLIMDITDSNTHDIIEDIFEQLEKTPLSVLHKQNMPLLSYLGTKFTSTAPKYLSNPPKHTPNIFDRITSLNNPTKNMHLPKPTILPTLSPTQAQEILDQKANRPQANTIPQKVLNLKTNSIEEHRYNITLVDETNAMSRYLTTQMVAVPATPNQSAIYPPKGFCPYQRTERDPESTEPITFLPKLNNHYTSAVPLNIPYMHNTEHARLVYACNNIKQALQLKNPEEPLCRTINHRTLAIGVNLKATFAPSLYTYEDAVIISETAARKLETIDGKFAMPGDKLTGRHGNKAVISAVIPDDKMPEGAEIVFSPMAVTSRKNFGFLAEIQSNIMHNNQPHVEVPIETLLAQPDPKVNGYLTGMVYILRNSHTAEHGTKSYGTATKFDEYHQPISGESLSLNHTYALEALKAHSLIHEFFSFRSNETQIVNNTYNLNTEPESLAVIRALYKETL